MLKIDKKLKLLSNQFEYHVRTYPMHKNGVCKKYRFHISYKKLGNNHGVKLLHYSEMTDKKGRNAFRILIS